MPEGPDIRRAAQAVHRGIAGQPLRMTLAYPALAPMTRALRGATVESVSARSKAMLTRFSTGDVLCVPMALYRVQRQQGVSFEAARFFVFGRAQQPCRECGATVERATLGGRKLFVCIACQSVLPLPDELRR